MLGYFLLFGLFLGTCYWIINPLLQGGSRLKSIPSKPENILEELKNKKHGAYAAIKELEFDLHMGKLTEEDFQALKKQYAQEAVGYMKEMDRITFKPEVSHETESEIPEKDSEQKAAMAGNQKPVEGKYMYCTSCGKKASIESRFCTACGSKLN